MSDKGDKSERMFFDEVEIRIEPVDEKELLRGHAAVFDKLSVPMWGFREKIAPGAFLKSIKKDDVRALWNHNPNYVLGRNKAKTLKLSEDERGLYVEVDPPNATWANDLKESIRRGDVNQMSFGFKTIRDEWLHNTGKESIRTLLEVDLFDVSVVTYPAYPQTDIKVRSALGSIGINYDLLSDIIFRSQHDQQLRDEDHELIKRSIEVLSGFLPQELPPAGSEEDNRDDEKAGRLIIIKKQLELAELALK